MRYLGNAFSLGMLDIEEVVDLRVRPLKDIEEVKFWLWQTEWQSGVGHTDTAMLLSEMLGAHVSVNRVSLSLNRGDELLVAQYTGPRLPEGATTLPAGAKIRWYVIGFGPDGRCESCGLSDEVYRVCSHRCLYDLPKSGGE